MLNLIINPPDIAFHLSLALLILFCPLSHSFTITGHISRDCPQSTGNFGGGSSGGFGSGNSSGFGASSSAATPAPKEEEEARPVINWKQLYEMAEENKMAKWKDEPPIVKKFYVEHPEVTRQSAE